MKKKIFMTGLAALGLAATPVMAEAIAPTTQPVTSDNELGDEGSGGAIALALLAGVLAIIVITVIDDDNGDDDPVSA